jgi:hypothetical protein
VPRVAGCRVPQVSLVLGDLGVAKSAASVIMYRRFRRHFGKRIAGVVLAQVSQRRRDLGHPAADATTSVTAGRSLVSRNLCSSFRRCNPLGVM